MSNLETKALQVCHFFLVVTFPLALLAGILTLAWRAVEPQPWAAFSVTLGTALLVYSTVAFTIWLTALRTLGKPSKPTQTTPDTQAPAGRGQPAASGDTHRGRVADRSGDSSPAGPAKPDWGTIIHFVVKLFRALLVLGMLGIALFVSGLATPPGFFWNSFGRLAGTGLLAALGFYAAGTLLGFLFGLPRSPRPSRPATPGGPPQPPVAASPTTAAAASSGTIPATASSADPPVKTNLAQPAATPPTHSNSDDKPTDNTNLEEVSDWLTKIIVGLGLVELKGLPDQARRLVDFFNHRCGSEFCGGIFLMMGVFFFVIGFISAYVLARVYLKLAIYLTGQLLEQSQLDKVREEVQEAKLTPSPMSLVQEARESIRTKGVTETQLQKAIELLDQAIRDAPSNDIKQVALVVKGAALKRQALSRQGGERTELLRKALDMATLAHQLQPTYGAAVYNQACYKALLGTPIKEFADDLKQAFRLNPPLREEAGNDTDFTDEMRASAEFRALTRPERLVEEQRSIISKQNVTETELNDALRVLDLILDSGPADKTKLTAYIERANALRGLALLKQGDDRKALLGDAIRTLAQALQLDPDNAVTLYKSAALKALGGAAFTEFAGDLTKALALNPLLKAAAKVDPDFPATMPGHADFAALTGP